MFSGNDPQLAIASRIKSKVAKSKLYTFAEVDQVWLLVVANLLDVPAATFVPPHYVTEERLNRISATELSNRNRTGFLFHNHALHYSSGPFSANDNGGKLSTTLSDEMDAFHFRINGGSCPFRGYEKVFPCRN